MNTQTKLHIKALSNHVEATIIAGLLIVITDLGWCIKDIIAVGFDLGYGLILFGLSIGTIYLLEILVHFHHTCVVHHRHQMLAAKVKHIKKRGKK